MSFEFMGNPSLTHVDQPQWLCNDKKYFAEDNVLLPIAPLNHKSSLDFYVQLDSEGLACEQFQERKHMDVHLQTT